jgi:hypothetical protein
VAFKSEEIDEACCCMVGNMRNAHRIFAGNLINRGNLEDLGFRVVVRIILLEVMGRTNRHISCHTTRIV